MTRKTVVPRNSGLEVPEVDVSVDITQHHALAFPRDRRDASHSSLGSKRNNYNERSPERCQQTDGKHGKLNEGNEQSV